MRIVFMGTPEFAVASLERLLNEGHEVVAVVSASNKTGGRGRKAPIISAVSKFAMDRAIPLLQPEKLRDASFIASLQNYHADLFVVVAFRMLPEAVWSIPSLGTINLHGSLLPYYRGAAPIHWAVLNGEIETGVTIFFLKQDIDTGDIIHQEHIPIGAEEETGSVHDRMMYIGARALVRAMHWIEEGSVLKRRQSDEFASHAPKIYPETAVLDFNWSALKLFNWVRGMSPYPAAWFVFLGKKYKVFKLRPLSEQHSAAPGTLWSGPRFLKIACADGWIELLEIQPEGRNRMAVVDFLNGVSWGEGLIGCVDEPLNQAERLLNN